MRLAQGHAMICWDVPADPAVLHVREVLPPCDVVRGCAAPRGALLAEHILEPPPPICKCFVMQGGHLPAVGQPGALWH
jgi:hypothetical protein